MESFARTASSVRDGSAGRFRLDSVRMFRATKRERWIGSARRAPRAGLAVADFYSAIMDRLRRLAIRGAHLDDAGRDRERSAAGGNCEYAIVAALSGEALRGSGTAIRPSPACVLEFGKLARSRLRERDGDELGRVVRLHPHQHCALAILVGVI